ncbi:NUAK family SNF1-like kinase 2 [Leptonychotes weddellii]|uniref:non-specific serine/threonine protein kinase n=1 Tax=Leptonychotes weddellii TaxID=9713 RepID=A0A7F8PVC1_LEPWE|nr:NUAK family SNF1-like kinase 2 [Leptonychotes weddellii]
MRASVSPTASTSDPLMSLSRQQTALGSEIQRDEGLNKPQQPEYRFQAVQRPPLPTVGRERGLRAGRNKCGRSLRRRGACTSRFLRAGPGSVHLCACPHRTLTPRRSRHADTAPHPEERIRDAGSARHCAQSQPPRKHTPVQVAIKIISTAEAPVFSQKFLPREISSLNATYKHLNVVQLYETYQNSQRSYLVLELAARGDLLEHINVVSDRCCHPGLGEEAARRLFWQLVSAVAHCHSSGIVHRDLKCDNILLDDQGLRKLTAEPVAQPHPLPWTP